MLSSVLFRIRTMKSSIAITALLVIVSLVAVDMAVSSSRHLGWLEGQVRQNNQQIDEYHSSIKNLSQQNASALAEERAALPNTLDIPSVLMETAGVARSAGVTLSAFQFNPSTTASQNNGVLTEPNVQPYVVNVTATGTRDQIIAFIAGLEMYHRFTTVQTVTYQVGTSSTIGSQSPQSASIAFDVYTDP